MSSKKAVSSNVYNPLYFLSSLGAGGLTVAFWKFADVAGANFFTNAGQIIFLTIATILFVWNLPLWFRDLRKNGKFFDISLPSEYTKTRAKLTNTQPSPVTSTGWMAMPASLAMLLNAMFAVLPTFTSLPMNDMAPYGFWVWLLAYIIAFVLGFQILFNTFANTTTLKEFHFGLFLQPLTYGLVAIPGISMVSMLPKAIGEIALLLGLTAFAIGGMIGALALIFIFQRFFTYGLPDPKVAPTTLLIMPSITIYSIFFFRMLHYLAHHGVEMPPVIFEIVALLAIGLMGAAATLGIIILAIYFKTHVPFGASWWSFVCPFVALSVLSSVAYEFTELPMFLWSATTALIFVSLVYIYVALNTLLVIGGKSAMEIGAPAK